MELSEVFKLALGAVWTAGFRPGMDSKFELQRACGYFDHRAAYRGDGLTDEEKQCDGFELLRRYIKAQAIRALTECGYPIAPEPEGLDLLTPLPTVAAGLADRRPQPGDIIRVNPYWTLTDCTEVGLQGQLGDIAPGYTIANRRGGWHCGTKVIGPNFLSMGCGGPASIARLDVSKLAATEDTDRLSVWDFAFTPQAHHGVYFSIPVRVFDWTPAGDSDWLELSGESD